MSDGTKTGQETEVKTLNIIINYKKVKAHFILVNKFHIFYLTFRYVLE